MFLSTERKEKRHNPWVRWNHSRVL